MFRFGEPIYLYLLLGIIGTFDAGCLKISSGCEVLAGFSSLNYGYFYVGTSSVRF